MDLEEFEHRSESKSTSHSQGELSPELALRLLDEIWYQQATRRSRWMDLIGDYGGREMFFIDGDSLLSLVFDTPSLALGRSIGEGNETNSRIDNSFQLFHAKHILDKYLENFIQRDTNFEVVFFDVVRHTAIGVEDSSFSRNSRALCRKLLFHHIIDSNITVHVFESPADQAWRDLVLKKQPMFILANDGGTPVNAPINQYKCSLLQRALLFELSRQGLAFALLKGAEYRDSKILTFVYESRTYVQELKFPHALQHRIDCSRHELDEKLGYVTPLSTPTTQHPLAWWSSKLPSEDLTKVFLLHAAILPQISVQLLARKLPVLHPELESRLHNNFLPTIFRILAQTDGLFPHIDGRLFLELLSYTIRSNATSCQDIYPSSCENGTELDFLSELTFDGPGLATLYGHVPSNDSQVAVSSVPQHELLPFSNHVFDAALANVRAPNTPQSTPAIPPSIFGMHILANDTKHWHNTRALLPVHLGGQKTKPRTEWEKRRHDRREHREQTRLQRQAASLVGASGNMLKKITIAPVGSKPPTKAKVSESQSNKKAKKEGGSKLTPGLTGANKARAKILEDKLKKTGKEAIEWWEEKLKAMNDSVIEDQLKSIEYLKRNPSAKATHPTVAFEMRLYCLHLIIKDWTMKSNPDDHCDKQVVKILCLLSEIKTLPVSTIPKTASKFLVDLCLSVGLERFTDTLLPQVDVSSEACTFKPIKLVSKGIPLYPFMAIKSSPIDWQLENFGNYMDRSMDSAADPRVAFSPDRWQREVLDAIDENKSILAIAPTSAGKTFISFYAMEKVLRESDNGVLVYVAPTKALVNQIAAEIYGRFSKHYSGSQTLLAVHTRDTRTGDLQRAQILVTVPEMLGILILSPMLAQNWTSRVKRIILDEIHSIGQEQGGAVWEQIILLAPCPVIGLSATVGSPQEFNKWLASVQLAHCFPHVYIHHPHRYSHLRKFFFLPSHGRVSFTSLSEHKITERLTFLHPISLLSSHSNTLPVDMALESRDCLSLYRALRRHSVLKDEELSPDVYFESRSSLICQKDILDYEKELKDVLVRLLVQDPSAANRIVASLTSEALTQAEVDIPPSKDDFKEGVLILLCDLNKQDNLPAILFSFDRTDCEVMAKVLVNKLESAESKWKQNSRSWKSKLAEVESWRKMDKLRSAQRQKETKQKKDPDAPREDTASYAWQATFNENEPLADFSFAGRPPSMQELDEIIQELTRAHIHTPEWAIRALRRGIAVHHAGMPKGYRVAIENLFRQGYIRVMISTGTLALGINAPARTSVFCGDSPYLTALMYRQCAGRAGRRGFDLLGNVVFYGLPYSRVQRLVLSRLPALGDSFPLTSTFILRLFNLLQGSEYAEFAVNSVKSVMNLPRISHRSDMGRDQVLHHVRFSIEYLRRSGLLSHEGKPMNLFGIAAHLYHTEPANLAFVHLFETGIIHKICGRPSSVTAEKELLLLLCHLFGRRYIPHNYSQPEHITKLREKYPSLVILPPLPSDVGAQLQHHNNDILQMFTSYALSYATENHTSLGIDNTLPLSDVPIAGNPLFASPFVDHLNQTMITPVARSIFAATSGLDDNFSSIYDLVSTVRKGIHLHEHAIPSMQGFINHSALPNSTREHELNAYIFDFYYHGQLSSLMEANGIRRGDVWYELQEFYLTLKTIKTSLQELLVQLSLARQREVVDVSDLFDADTERIGEDDVSEEDDDMVDDGIEGFQRPPKTSASDWRVYEIFALITDNFEEKFHDIFA
ncbi:hypothetical protein F5880DRAFT_1562443 [Lentinula raphanica]|nr:hypothetical protein F5880DRAFT_1562443 [Lentinula raphanica]